MTTPPAIFHDIKTPAQLPRVERAPVTDRLPQFVSARLSRAETVRALEGMRVFLIGAGAVGRVVAAHFARLGVREIKISDAKKYSAQSLLTQFITAREVGEWKAGSTGRLVKSLSPRTRVRVFNGPAQALPLTEFIDTDIVLLATDNLSVEQAVSDRCVKAGQPLAQGSVHGETMTVQVRFLSNHHAQGPCLCCLYGAEEFSALNREVLYSCDGHRAKPGAAQIHAPRTASTSTTCSLSADLLVTTVLRWRLGLAAPVADTLLEYNCLSSRAITVPLKRNHRCRCAHERFEIIRARRPLSGATLGALAKAAGLRSAEGPVAFTVDDLIWAEDGVCDCPEPRSLNHFIPVGQTGAGRCRVCRKPIAIVPFMTHRHVSADVLGPALDRPLRSLGAATAQTVLVRRPGRPVLFLNPSTQGVTT